MLLQEFVENSALAIAGINDEPQSKLEQQQEKLAAELTSDRKREIGQLMAEKRRKKQKTQNATAAATPTTSNNSSAELDHRIRTIQAATNNNATQLVLNQLYQDPHLTLPPSVLVTAEQPRYQPYPTTLGLILLLHLIFGHQWNRHRTKRHSLASYKTLVQHKQFHRAVVAILSHPPTSNSNNNTSDGAASRTAVDIGTAATATHPLASAPGLAVHHRLQVLLHPILSGHLSGLPLLFYNSHILWACRSLEVQSTGNHYLHELIGLAAVAMALELQWKHVLLKLLFRGGQAAFLHARRRLPLVPLGSLTGLSAALLMRYRHSIPHVAIQIFPLVSISSSSYMIPIDPAASHGLALALLAWCSYKTHSGIFFGTVSGLLWNWGLTSWLGHAYWGTILVWWMGMASCLSLKAAAGAEETIPVVDYVSWDARGRMLESHENVLEALDDTDDMDETIDDMDDDNSIVVDPENPTRARSTIRGRLPPLMVLDEGGPSSLSAASWTGGGDSQAAARRRGNFLST